MASSFGFFVKEGIGIRLLCGTRCGVLIAVHPGVKVEALQEAHCRDHSTDPEGAVAAGRGCEACGPGTQEEAEKEPRELEQTLECLKVHDVRVHSSSLLSGEQGPKQRQSTSGSPKWHLFGLQETSRCPCTVAMATAVQRLLRACSKKKGGVEGTW